MDDTETDGRRKDTELVVLTWNVLFDVYDDGLEDDPCAHID